MCSDRSRNRKRERERESQHVFVMCVCVCYVLYVPLCESYASIFDVYSPVCVCLGCYKEKSETSEYGQGEIPVRWCDARQLIHLSHNEKDT